MALLGCKEESLEDKRNALDNIQIQMQERLSNIEIEDDAVRMELERVARSLVWLHEMEIDALDPPNEVKYQENPFLWLEDYPSTSELFDNYRGGILAFTDEDYRLGSVDILLPFDYPFGTTLTWKEVELADGTTVPVSGDFEINPPDVQVANAGTALRVIPSTEPYDENTPRPTQVRGGLEIEVPDTFARMTLREGERRQIGSYVVSVTAVEGHNVTVSVERQDRGFVLEDPIDITIAAKDQTGRYLDSSGSSTGTGDDSLAEYIDILFNFMKDLEKRKIDIEIIDIEAEMAERSRDLKEKYGHQIFETTSFRGQVETVEVLFASEIKLMNVPLALDTILAQNPGYDEEVVVIDIPANSVAYDRELAYLTAPDRIMELPPEDVAAQIQIKQPRVWDEDVYVKFEYPENVISNLFLNAFYRYDFHFGDSSVTFLDTKGQALEDQPTYDLTVNRLEYQPVSTAIAPNRVRGQFEVRLMADVGIREYFASDLPAGVQIVGNRVHWEQGEDLIFALDYQGRVLRKFHTVRFPSSSSPSLNVDYYYGKPETILVVSKGSTESVTYTFDTQLDRPETE